MKKGFTLAEVLITLGIIGIVAAMTIPQVLANYRKKALEAKLKKTYTELLAALNKGEQEIGLPFSTYSVMTLHPNVCPTNYEFNACASTLYDDYLKDNLSSAVVSPPKGYLNSVYTSSGGRPISIGPTKAFMFPNGIYINIYSGAMYLFTDKAKMGKKIILKPGKNYFQFGAVHISNNTTLKNRNSGLLPMLKNERAKYTRDDLRIRCQSDNNDTAVVACSQLFIEDGFVFKDDYPIKF